MQRRLLLILIIILVTSTWWVDENLRLTSMQAIAASQKLAVISSIKDGSVQRKKPGGVFQSVGVGTFLYDGDLVKTIGTNVKVTLDCTDATLRDWSLSGNSLVGVANGCKRGDDPNNNPNKNREKR